MHRFKITLLLGFLFLVNSAFNACSEAEFSSVEPAGSNKVVGVVDENFDEEEEVADLDEDYGVGEDDNNNDTPYVNPRNPGNRGGHVCDKDEYRNRKVKICHVPPGNPDAKHTIVVGWPAVRAHVDRNHNHEDAEHKDYFGDCKDGDVVIDDGDAADGDDGDGGDIANGDV